jgi:hypothetical protein
MAAQKPANVSKAGNTANFMIAAEMMLPEVASANARAPW